MKRLRFDRDFVNGLAKRVHWRSSGLWKRERTGDLAFPHPMGCARGYHLDGRANGGSFVSTMTCFLRAERGFRCSKEGRNNYQST